MIFQTTGTGAVPELFAYLPTCGSGTEKDNLVWIQWERMCLVPLGLKVPVLGGTQVGLPSLRRMKGWNGWRDL